MSSAKNLVGTKIGRLTLIKRKRENNRTYYYCRCDCGNEKWIRADHLGKVVSCGCLNKEQNLFKHIDIKGNKYGRLLVLNITDKRDLNNGSVIWECACDCGNKAYVPESYLVKGTIRSCGCLGRENSQNNISKAIDKHLETHIKEGTNLQVIDRDIPIKTNTSGVTGVKFDKTRQKWYAEIEFKGKKHYLGRYINKEDAVNARKEAEEKFFKPIIEKYK